MVFLRGDAAFGINLEDISDTQHASGLEDAHLGFGNDRGKVFVQEVADDADFPEIGAECGEEV